MATPKNSYRVIGVMSGTSLDGLDVACCRFVKNKRWEFEIETAQTIKYSPALKRQLASAHQLGAEELLALDVAYGRFIGSRCRDLMLKGNIGKVDAVSSHGHTIFHQPEKGFTFQLGHGAAIHATTGWPVVCDWRSLDVALGGEGAPLVPVGDRLLFGQYDVCLNLGGIANLSMEKSGVRIAFDLAYANMGLNYLARKAGADFDRDGRLAGRGKTNRDWLKKISSLYRPLRKGRPSLAREGFELRMVPLLDDESISLEDRLHTFCESISVEVMLSLPASKKKLNILVTGGGALNSVLIEIIHDQLKDHAHVIVPEKAIIEFKEALIFAFLGVLRLRGENNVLKSSTRASNDSCSGSLIGSSTPAQSTVS